MVTTAKEFTAIGRSIDEHARKAGITYSELARRIQRPRQQVHHALYYAAWMTMPNLIKFARALDCTVSDLLKYVDE